MKYTIRSIVAVLLIIGFSVLSTGKSQACASTGKPQDFPQPAATKMKCICVVIDSFKKPNATTDDEKRVHQIYECLNDLKSKKRLKLREFKGNASDAYGAFDSLKNCICINDLTLVAQFLNCDPTNLSEKYKGYIAGILLEEIVHKETFSAFSKKWLKFKEVEATPGATQQEKDDAKAKAIATDSSVHGIEYLARIDEWIKVKKAVEEDKNATDADECLYYRLKLKKKTFDLFKNVLELKDKAKVMLMIANNSALGLSSDAKKKAMRVACLRFAEEYKKACTALKSLCKCIAAVEALLEKDGDDGLKDKCDENIADENKPDVNAAKKAYNALCKCKKDAYETWTEKINKTDDTESKRGAKQRVYGTNKDYGLPGAAVTEECPKYEVE